MLAAGPVTTSSVRSADKEDVEPAAVDADRHPQGHTLAEHGEPAHLDERTSHFEGGATSPLFVLGPGEQQQQSVSTEFHEFDPPLSYAMPRRWTKHSPMVDGELFGADLAVLGESLGQFGESGDVDESDRAVDDTVALARHGGDPIDDEAREIGGQEFRLRRFARATNDIGPRRRRDSGLGDHDHLIPPITSRAKRTRFWWRHALLLRAPH